VPDVRKVHYNSDKYYIVVISAVKLKTSQNVVKLL